MARSSIGLCPCAGTSLTGLFLPRHGHATTTVTTFSVHLNTEEGGFRTTDIFLDGHDSHRLGNEQWGGIMDGLDFVIEH